MYLNEFVNIYESSGGQTGESWFVIGNKPDGIGFYALLRPQGDFPESIRSASLRLAEMDYPDYRGATPLTMKISRVTGSWSSGTKWNTVPAFDSGVYASKLLDNAAPGSGNYSYRTGYHAAQYQYKREYQTKLGDEWGTASSTNVWLSSYGGTSYTQNLTATTRYRFTYIKTASAYYDTYVLYHDIDVTRQIRDIVIHGGTGLILWFDLPGVNNNRKYFKSPDNSNANLLPMLTINLPSGGVIEIPLTVAPTEGAFNKRVLGVTVLAGNKTVMGIKVAPVAGAINKTVF